MLVPGRSLLEAYSSYLSKIARKTPLPRPDDRLSSLIVDAEMGRKEGVHNVHTGLPRRSRTVGPLKMRVYRK